MRGRTLAALAALAVVDLAVVALGYRAHTGSLPPMQRSSEAFVVVASPTADPTGSPTEAGDVVGPVLVGVNAQGDVLRATRGACETRFDSSARMWAGNVDDDVALAAVEPPPGLREVLGLMVYADGALRVSGLTEEECQPVTFDSSDAGATWQASDDVASVWRLSGDVTASAVTGPRGASVAVPCPASQIVNLPARRAVASCAHGTYFFLAAGEPVSALAATGYTQLSVTLGRDDRYYVFGTTSECTASLGVARPEDQSVEELECFDEDKAPLAIASAEGLLVIQLGNDLRVSRDDGETFETLAAAAS